METRNWIVLLIWCHLLVTLKILLASWSLKWHKSCIVSIQVYLRNIDLLINPFNPHGQNFSLQYQYNIKQTSVENREKYK